jgi:hypothetical protein
MNWNFDFFFILCNWIWNFKLLFGGLGNWDLDIWAMAWLTWAEILNFFLYYLWLNFKPQAVCWYQSPRLGSHELKFWFFFFILCDGTSNFKLFVDIRDQSLVHMSLNFEFFLHSLELNFKLQTACWRSRQSRPSYQSRRLGSYELLFCFLFFILCDWTSNLKL